MKSLFAAILLLSMVSMVSASSTYPGGVARGAAYFNASGCATWHWQAQSVLTSLQIISGQFATMQTSVFAPANSISQLVTAGGASYLFPLTKALGAKADLIYFEFTNDGPTSCFGRLMGDSVKANWPLFPIQ